LAIDIAAAYGSDNLQALARAFRFVKTGTSPSLELTDEFRFAREPSSVVERFVTPFAPELMEPGRIRIAAAAGGGEIAVGGDVGEIGGRLDDRPDRRPGVVRPAVDLLYDVDRFEFRTERAEYMSHRGNPQRRVLPMQLHLLD